MSNEYSDKMNDYMESIKNLMYTFEITKCCEYSTFVTVYKDETLLDLFGRIIIHFGGICIKRLYFIDPSTNEQIDIPLSYKPVYIFVKENVVCNPRRLVPVYTSPSPVVYKIYLDDGSHRH